MAETAVLLLLKEYPRSCNSLRQECPDDGNDVDSIDGPGANRCENGTMLLIEKSGTPIVDGTYLTS